MSERRAWVMTGAVARRAVSTATAVVLLGGPVAAGQQSGTDVRVVLGATGETVTFEAMTEDLAAADVVFLGERHAHAGTHRLELAVLEAVGRRRDRVVLALEMFDRDVQEVLEHFLMGHVDEADFAREARAWPRYGRDYKPLVDLAMARGWPVVAANVAKVVVDAVTRSGLEALDDRPQDERVWYAADLECPTDDAYFSRFREAMSGHDAAVPAGDASLEHYYQAQCLRDETMAESVARAHAIAAIGGGQPLVVSVNGSFHVDFGAGTVARTRRRMPDRRVMVVSFLPVRRVDRAEPDEAARQRADYLVYVTDTRRGE